MDFIDYFRKEISTLSDRQYNLYHEIRNFEMNEFTNSVDIVNVGKLIHEYKKVTDELAYMVEVLNDYYKAN